MGRCLTESLEPRRLFAVFAAATPPTLMWVPSIGLVNAELTSRGTLVIHGSGAADHISVTKTDGDYVVQTGSGDAHTLNISRVFDVKKVKRILVEGAGGDDYLSVQADLPATLTGENGNDVLVGGRGDVLVGGAGDDKLLADYRGTSFTLQDLQNQNGLNTGAPSELHGGPGRDRLYGFSGDTLDGGGGQDRGFLYQVFGTATLPPLPDNPSIFAQDAFGSRGSSIELWGVERTGPMTIFHADGSTTIVINNG